jgi:hypothetical protein
VEEVGTVLVTVSLVVPGLVVLVVGRWSTVAETGAGPLGEVSRNRSSEKRLSGPRRNAGTAAVAAAR